MADGRVTFDITCLPKPDGGPDVIVPEVVQPGQKHAPSDATSKQCSGCARGDAPHRDEKGKIRPGHTFNASGRPKGSKNRTTKLAAEALQGASLLAAQRLIEGVRSQNEWVASACARVIIERTIPPEVLSDQGAGGPLLIFPPGTVMAVGNRELASAAAGAADRAGLPEETATRAAEDEG